MHKHRRSQVPKSATHQPKSEAEHRHVSEVKRRLKICAYFAENCDLSKWVAVKTANPECFWQ